jgi:hypothetical protein
LNDFKRNLEPCVLAIEEDYRSDWGQNLELEQAGRRQVFHMKEWKVSFHELVSVYYLLIGGVECTRLAKQDQC